MEDLNPVLTFIAGAFGTIILYWALPDLRKARVGREVAESDKVSAESDSIQLGAIGDVLLTMTQNLATTSALVQSNASDYAGALKKVADSNIEMLAWVREKEIQMSEERHLLISRIEELGAQLKQLQLEKDALEDILEAAQIKIAKLENDTGEQRQELKKLEKDYKALKIEYDKLKTERDGLLLQLSSLHMPPQLEADTLQTHILKQDGKDNENSSTSSSADFAGDTANS